MSNRVIPYSEMVFHADKAEEWLRAASSSNSPENAIAVAQVHATLAVAWASLPASRIPGLDCKH